MLIPLDGSQTAEQVLPYARFLAGKRKNPVELMGIIDIAAIATHISEARGRYLDTLVAESERASEEYLKEVAKSFHGINVKCTVLKGSPADVIIERAQSDKNTLVAMATHGRSGVERWLLGSVAEKVLRALTNPLLLVRAGKGGKSEGETSLKSVIVPLDGSPLAETVLPCVVELGKALNFEVILLRAYAVPYQVYGTAEDYYLSNYDELLAQLKDEAVTYLEKKVGELKSQGLSRVSFVAPEGLGADEIISLGRKTPDNLIAMCTHGRSGVKRWVLGSVTEKVVRHSGDPVLVIRAA
jgi:nucleotide-binding universal stress UspA family protein